ncbi:hypothetical protein CERZMDRAFT_97183 [Cercospora zeae-maydis SCOH1-5]|uniref:Uncharacterized protein n=1 Tax=Cercospora zeae-maydis SCOH1-5 TaxID=717836 RepID=A0A6A6FHH2_9PEZI|nr:hypothetical protein CERZMDRAFT_97183 [Cercospora zeae-maydis SCOH1-5]
MSLMSSSLQLQSPHQQRSQHPKNLKLEFPHFVNSCAPLPTTARRPTFPRSNSSSTTMSPCSTAAAFSPTDTSPISQTSTSTMGTTATLVAANSPPPPPPKKEHAKHESQTLPLDFTYNGSTSDVRSSGIMSIRASRMASVTEHRGNCEKCGFWPISTGHTITTITGGEARGNCDVGAVAMQRSRRLKWLALGALLLICCVMGVGLGLYFGLRGD